MAGLNVCIMGATGYAGQECARLLRHHPHVARLDLPRSAEGVNGVAADADVVLLATPADIAAAAAWPLVQRGHRVIDLSGAHRAGNPEAHLRAYGFDHPHPEALAVAVYAFAAPSLGAARLLANPGCYANGILSALWPLQQAGLLAAGAVADVTGISGVSGAGRKASERTMFMTVAENLSPYKMLRSHPHVVEVERAVAVRLLFTPLVAPLRRGMLLSGTVQARPGVGSDALEGLVLAQDPLWRSSPEPPDVHSVTETALVRVHWALDAASGRIAFVSVLDNLLRGAASHAVVQLNRLFGLEDLSGLDAVLGVPDMMRLPEVPAAAPYVDSVIDIEPCVPVGVRLYGGHSGIKAARADTALLVFDRPTRAAGVFTRNRCAAACVHGNRALVPTEAARAFIVVSGNANCYAEGDTAADQRLRSAVADLLACPQSAVLTATTGPIGVPFDVARVETALSGIAAGVPSWSAFADAVLTTDTVRKVACVTWGGATWLGIAKGSGMIHPDMATMIAFCVTDADVPLDALNAAVRRAAQLTFNAVTVDRDTSTNDTALAFATGHGPHIADPLPGVQAVFERLAKAIARDGEGATRLVAVQVSGASSEAVARTAARDVAGSDLVKAAVFACDPNWGRIAAALGASLARQEVSVLRDDVRIHLQGELVFPAGALDKAALSAAMRSADTITIDVQVGTGPGKATAWGCDLTYDYVRINAEAPIAYGQGAPVRSNLEMQTLTPVLKKGVLREALRYLHAFDRTAMVFLVQADAPTTVDDLALLRLTGVRPIVLRDATLDTAVAVARDNHATKVIVLSADDGIRGEDGRVQPELTLDRLPAQWRAEGLAEFLAGGGTMHVLNGTVHAALIEELFTDRGLGTMVTG